MTWKWHNLGCRCCGGAGPICEFCNEADSLPNTLQVQISGVDEDPGTSHTPSFNGTHTLTRTTNECRWSFGAIEDGMFVILTVLDATTVEIHLQATDEGTFFDNGYFLFTISSGDCDSALGEEFTFDSQDGPGFAVDDYSGATVTLLSP